MLLFNIQPLSQIMAPLWCLPTGLNIHSLRRLPHRNLPVSAPSSWLEALWEEGSITLPDPPPSPPSPPRPERHAQFSQSAALP